MSQQGPIIFNGRYELHSKLGRGGMAEVYLARDQMLDRPVAVKVLFPALATDPGFVERFRREAQAAASLTHPNIVGVFDWGEANGTYFIVMEYVQGETLDQLIHSSGRLHPDRAAEIGGEIASALDFAHRSGGVIHRDIKPGNVLITREGSVKVADFGIARAISDSSSDRGLTKTGSVMGTATYFSPEQARGASVDPRSDVYSLGCVLYEMVTGTPPFSGESAVAIAYKHVQEMPATPRMVDPALPDTLEAIILKCLAKNPDNRYPSAQDLRADLRRYLDGARIMAEPVMAPLMDPGATGLMAPTGYMEPTAAWGEPYDDTYGEEPYEEEEEPQKSKKFLVVLLILLAILAGLLIWWALSGGGAAQVEVPQVGLQTEEQARNVLEEAGFEVEVETAPHPEVPEGLVSAQDPEPGEMADEGSTVTITVSEGPGTVPVPDVVGATEEEAVQQIEDAGLVPRVEQVSSDDVEEDLVVSTQPPPNTEVDPGAEVVINVSTGPGTVEVPNVEGLSESEARSSLEGAGFEVNRTEQAHDSVPEGNVIGTNPAPGTQVAPGQTVTMVVSTGPGTVQVPNVVGVEDDDAADALEAQGFNVSQVSQSTNNPNEDGIVLRTEPSPGSQVPPGSTVIIVVGDHDDD
jgi:eukaryotic-like serine/threonine-protein kinase